MHSTTLPIESPIELVIREQFNVDSFGVFYETCPLNRVVFANDSGRRRLDFDLRLIVLAGLIALLRGVPGRTCGVRLI